VSASDNPLDSLLDRLADIAVYAPLGLALLAREEIPKLAAHGRERVSAQAELARMVGQMAVAQGRRQAQSLLARRPPAEGDPAPAVSPSPPGRAVPIRELRPDEPPAGPPVPVVAAEVLPDVAPPAAVAPVAPVAPGADAPLAPEPDDLPIPGYDSLSASQVVQRLAGLSAAELEAVRAYEQAGRGRKTVLLRVAQLRAAS
jgi:hypothetical protein